MRITKLTKPGDLRSWLEDTCREGQDTVALDLEWRVRNGRDDVIYSGAVTGPTADDCAVFGPELLGELMEAPEGLLYVLHHAPSDLKHLAWAGYPLHERYEFQDTLVLAHLLDENGSHRLGDLVKECYGDDYKAEFKAKYRLPEDAPPEENDVYNAKDVSYTRALFDLLHERLKGEQIPESLISHVYSLQRSLLSTEIAGIAVDKEYLLAKGVDLKTRIAELLPKMRSLVQDEIDSIEIDAWLVEIEKRKSPAGKARVERPVFNWDSPKQLLKLMYDKLHLPVQYGEAKKDKKTQRYKQKQPTVDDKALKELSPLHPVCNELRHYRAFQKAYGTYVEGILEKLVDGRIYPSFNVTGTKTGRISHSDPNMGNLPSQKKSIELDEPFLAGLRGMFVPEPGCCFVSADFSQLEVTLSAHFTQDKNLLRIVNEGVSQHDITAEGLSIPRSLAKTVNFGMQFGCSHKKVAKVLKVSEEEGLRAYEKYWETYSGQRRVMLECAEKVDKGEPIVSPFGRRRRFDVRKRAPWDSAYRQAWNALIQGTGSDLTSRALYLTDQALRSRGIGRALFSVHDEIVTQVTQGHEEEAEKILLSVMADVGTELGLSVPLRAQGSGSMIRWED